MTRSSKPSRRDLLAAGAAGIAALTAGAPDALADAPKTHTHLPQARPEDLGLDPKRLQVAYDLLEKWTNGPKAPVPGGEGCDQASLAYWFTPAVLHPRRDPNARPKPGMTMAALSCNAFRACRCSASS